MTPTTEYREIPLTQGQVAIVDAADYEWLNQWKWYAQRARNVWYAARRKRISVNKSTIVLMHREILGISDDKSVEGDHQNRNTLDNRRSNLRECTSSQNKCNQGVRSSNTSGFKGVYFNKTLGFYTGRIRVKGKLICCYRHTAQEAYDWYCQMAKQHHGDFARTQ